MPLASKESPDQDLTLNENLERQIREYGDTQCKRTNVKAHMTDWFMHDNSKGFQWVCNRAIDIATENNPHQLDMIAYDCWVPYTKMVTIQSCIIIGRIFGVLFTM